MERLAASKPGGPQGTPGRPDRSWHSPLGSSRQLPRAGWVKPRLAGPVPPPRTCPPAPSTHTALQRFCQVNHSCKHRHWGDTGAVLTYLRAAVWKGDSAVVGGGSSRGGFQPHLDAPEARVGGASKSGQSQGRRLPARSRLLRALLQATWLTLPGRLPSLLFIDKETEAQGHSSGLWPSLGRSPGPLSGGREEHKRPTNPAAGTPRESKGSTVYTR